MVLVDMAFEEMLQRIRFTDIVMSETLMPSKYPHCPPKEFWVSPYYYKKVPTKEEEIPPNSCLWKFFMNERCDREVKYIMHIVESKRGDYGEPAKGLVGLSLENAFSHGNQNNPELPVYLNAYDGADGLVVRIKDSGKGFDFRRKTSTIKRLFKKDPEFDHHLQQIKYGDRFFKRLGSGFRLYFFTKDEVSFEEPGNVVNLMFHNSTKRK